MTTTVFGVARAGCINDKGMGACFPNMTLGTSVSDQETFEEAGSSIIRAHEVALAQHLVLSAEPLVGEIDFLSQPWVERVDSIILGGESGPKARENHLAWFDRALKQMAKTTIVPYVKQLGANHWNYNPEAGDTRRVPLSDRAGADPTEWPVGFDVQAIPVSKITFPWLSNMGFEMSYQAMSGHLNHALYFDFEGDKESFAIAGESGWNWKPKNRQAVKRLMAKVGAL